MRVHDIVVIGGSAGGVEALVRLVRNLPADFPAAIFVVIHTMPTPDGRLPWILSRKGRLPATETRDGEAIRPGHIYVAPPDHHLTIEDGTARVNHGPRENRHRPAIDPLFRSAAHAYGPRVVGVLLSGMLNDGTAGVMAVKRAGGVAIIQDPNDALFPSMPRSALEHITADQVLPAPEIGPVLVGLARDTASEGGSAMIRDPIQGIEESVSQDVAAQERGERRGRTSVFTCPECGGVLWQVDEPGLAQFRCLAGHVYTGEGLLAEQAVALERALWTAARGLGEIRTLARELAGRSLPDQDREDTMRLRMIAQAADHHAERIRAIVLEDLLDPTGEAIVGGNED